MALAYLPNCSLCDTEVTLSITAGPVCSKVFRQSLRRSASFPLVSTAPKVCHFFGFLLLSDSRSDFLLLHIFWHIYQELSSLFFFTIKLQWVPGHSFLPGTRRLINFPDGVLFFFPLQSLVVSLLSYPLFSFLGLEAYRLI